MGAQGRASAYDDLAAPTERSLDLAEDERIKERRCLVMGEALLHVVALVADSVVEQHLGEPASLLHLERKESRMASGSTPAGVVT